MEIEFVNESDGTKSIKWIVDRARIDAFFIGKALAEYETVHDMDEQELASWLECNSAALIRLALCRMPDNMAGDFQQKVHQISEFVQCNADRLVQLMRETAVLSALREETQDTSGGFLLAARDLKEGVSNPRKIPKSKK